jgi:hypothetical protein
MHRCAGLIEKAQQERSNCRSVLKKFIVFEVTKGLVHRENTDDPLQTA